MSAKFYHSEVIANKKLNKKFHHLFLKANPKFKFIPGQFVTLKISDITYRCYSIASSPKKLPIWEMFVDITPNGYGTRYIAALKEGDLVEISKPRGAFTLKKNRSTNYVMAATGCGISPIKSIIELLLEKQKNTYFFWGLRHEADLALQNILKQWEKEYPFFKYEIVLSKGSSKWKGNKGHVNPLVISLLQTLPHNNVSIYMCGSDSFVHGLLQNLKDINFPLQKTYAEKY